MLSLDENIKNSRKKKMIWFIIAAIILVAALGLILWLILAPKKQPPQPILEKSYREIIYEEYETCTEKSGSTKGIKILGSIFDENNNGLKNSSIFINRKCVGKWSADGNVTFFLPKGKYHLYVYHPSYALYEQPVEVVDQ